MAVTLHVDWTNGQPLSGGTYTANTPDIPDNHTYTFSNAVLTQDNDAPWNGKYLADLSTSVRSVTTTVSGTTVANAAGRFCIKCEPLTENTKQFEAKNDSVLNGLLRVSRVAGNLEVLSLCNNDGQSNTVALGTYPTGPFAVEVIYDFNNATANQRLRARSWLLSGSPGTFTDATSTSGGASTNSAFTSIKLGSDDTSLGLMYGRVTFSDDITEDLSSYSESTQSNAPRAVHQLKLMGAM